MAQSLSVPFSCPPLPAQRRADRAAILSGCCLFYFVSFPSLCPKHLAPCPAQAGARWTRSTDRDKCGHVVVESVSGPWFPHGAVLRAPQELRKQELELLFIKAGAGRGVQARAAASI